jgi:hypothetical protein
MDAASRRGGDLDTEALLQLLESVPEAFPTSENDRDDHHV